MSSTRAIATAHANIALAKYWGKADVGRNLPAVPSLSMTLDGMTTRTEVVFDAALERDELELNGKVATPKVLARAVTLLDRVRKEANTSVYARVISHNDFPTASGLASSASGFAALALAARAAAGLPFDLEQASDLARQSSASAARSVYGGYVALDLGAQAARRVAKREHFPLSLVVGVTAEGEKAVGSTEGMEHTRHTSPYYSAWIESAPELTRRIEKAVLAADLAALGPLVEQSALSMHACMWAAAPAIVYFSAATLSIFHAVGQLRAAGCWAYCTMDAGPHVKVLCAPSDAPRVEAALQATPGVLRTLSCGLGPDAQVQLEPVRSASP